VSNDPVDRDAVAPTATTGRAGVGRADYAATMPIATFALVAIDCPEPRALAEFYQQIVGGEIQQNNTHGDWVRLATPEGSDIGFQRARDHQPPDWPSGTPQQLHLDFDVDDLDEGERAVLAIGARKADFQPEPHEWRVFLDPAGHPFCLVLA
jgi:predicted enzyme related to lactoylglutathione lyase